MAATWSPNRYEQSSKVKQQKSHKNLVKRKNDSSNSNSNSRKIHTPRAAEAGYARCCGGVTSDAAQHSFRWSMYDVIKPERSEASKI